jgi:8-oxo-dGTP diphosphatase
LFIGNSATVKREKMKRYVLGFAFDEKQKAVVLVLKNRPDWQKDKYNGIGGKIEPDESPIHAMVREFYEETGMQTNKHDWNCFAKMNFNNDILGGKAEVYVFKMFNNQICQCSTTTDELIVIVGVKNLSNRPLMHNVPLLIPLALQKEFIYTELNQSYKLDYSTVLTP